MLARLELDRGLEHLERRRIRGALGAPRLAEDASDFRDGLDEPIGLLQELRSLAGRQAGQGRRHVEQIAFVERWHEFAADVRRGIDRGRQDQQRDEDRRFWKREHLVEQRLVEANETAVERVLLLVGNLAADEVAHEHRDEGHGQRRRGGHRVGLGVRKRREETPFLGLQGEHRDERKRDDEERKEQCGTDLRCRLADHAPLLFALELLSRVRVVPRLDVLVRVLDHHHRRVHHRADGDRDAAERHDVGVHALVVHHDERHEDSERQRNDGDESRSQMEQEHAADERHHDEFLDELLLQVRDGALDEAGAVVRRDDLHPRRQAGLELLDLGLDRVDRLQRVLAGAHDDHAARHFALAVQLRDAAPHFGPHLHARDVAEPDRNATLGRRERDLAKIVERLQVSRGAHHVFRFPQLQHRSARFLVGFLHGVHHLAVRDVVGAQLVRVEHDLVLPHHAADAGHLRNVRHGLELVFEEPVLQRA